MHSVTKIPCDNASHSYTEEVDPEDTQEPVKRYLNLRKSEPDAIAGFGEFKVAKIMKKICLATGEITNELYVRSVVKNPKNGITTEPLIFAKIKESKGPAKGNVIHGTIFSFTKKGGTSGVAIVTKHYPKNFNSLRKEEKKAAMAQVARALAHLHDLGIVHCDINGKNILITQDNEPVICDVEGALLFDLATGALDSEFKEKRVEKRPFFLEEFSPPETKKYMGNNFYTLDFARAKKWDLYAFGLLVNYTHNLGIEVDITPSREGYIEAINDLPKTDKDYREYKLPLKIQNPLLTSAIIKCLQGQEITWQEIQEVL